MIKLSKLSRLHETHRMTSPLSADWIVTEWFLNDKWMATVRWISVALQPPFSQLNGRFISVTFQSVAIFVQQNITTGSARTRGKEMQQIRHTDTENRNNKRFRQRFVQQKLCCLLDEQLTLIMKCKQAYQLNTDLRSSICVYHTFRLIQIFISCISIQKH